MRPRAESVKSQCTDNSPTCHTSDCPGTDASAVEFCRGARWRGGWIGALVRIATVAAALVVPSGGGQAIAVSGDEGAMSRVCTGADGAVVEVTGISAGLGLADVRVRLEPALVAGIPLLVVRLGDDPTETVEVPMQSVVGGAEQAVFAARVCLSELAEGEGPKGGMPESERRFGTLRYSVRVVDADTSGRVLREFGPFEASTAPATGEPTPDWAKGCVWYQVFPERFRNGNPGNDPTGLDFFRKRWTSDWKSVDADELEAEWLRAAGRDMPVPVPRRRTRGQLDNVMHDRRYGGDLQGLVEKLEELKELGVDAIYLNPIFHAASLHKYDASDYRHIDPTLAHPGNPSDAERNNRLGEGLDPESWVWTPADRYFVDVLLVEARSRGMRVIIDGVWNHVGLEFWAFRDVMEHGAGSRYAAWFNAKFADAERFPAWATDPLDLRPGRLISWKSWGGGGRNGGLPELARDPNRDRQRLLPEIETHIWQVTSRWMDPNGDGDPSDGVDGWRLDVVPDVPMPFWVAWRDHVKSINPDAVLHCEVWFDAKDYFANRAFDGQMNYPFAMPLVRWLCGEPNATSERLAASLDRAFKHAPQTDLAQMNLLMSHDTDRLLSRLANPGFDYDQGAQMTARDTRYDDSRPAEHVHDLSVLACAIQATFAGAPMIYNGDELGMYGADDPDCRKPLAWPDLGSFENPDESGRPDIRERYRAWLSLRRDAEVGPTLRYGSLRLLQSGDPDVLLFERELNGCRVRVIANRSASAREHAGWVPPGARRKFVRSHDEPTKIAPRTADVWVISPD